MKDFIGNELTTDDYVAFARYPQSDLYIGKIIGFTPKGLKVLKKSKTKDGTWKFSPYIIGKQYDVVFPYQCAKIEYKEEGI